MNYKKKWLFPFWKQPLHMAQFQFVDWVERSETQQNAQDGVKNNRRFDSFVGFHFIQPQPTNRTDF